MKTEYNLKIVLSDAIQSYLRTSGKLDITHEDKFAVFINLVRSKKYSDAVLKELYYRIYEL